MPLNIKVTHLLSSNTKFHSYQVTHCLLFKINMSHSYKKIFKQNYHTQVYFKNLELSVYDSRIYVTAVGWRAGNTQFNFIWPESSPTGACAGSLQQPGSVMVMNTISTLWVGTHKPHRKVAGLVLSVLLTMQSQAIWLSN